MKSLMIFSVLEFLKLYIKERLNEMMHVSSN